ncbi:hypothetical protein D3C85_15200 [compost metagenome]
MTTERRVVIWTTPERKGQPWFINHYDRRDEPGREITEEDIRRYICPNPKKDESVRIPVQLKFGDSEFLRGGFIDLTRVTDLDFEVTYQEANWVTEVRCFVADEVEWSEHDRLIAWENIDVGQIQHRIRQARAYHRMSLAEIECKVAGQTISAEIEEYERRNRLPSLQYWSAVAKALGISSQWLIRGVAMFDIDRTINGSRYR